MAEIRRSRFARDVAAKSGNVSRSYLQYLLRAERHATIGTMISLAEGLGMRPEQLMAKTMEHFGRVRPAGKIDSPTGDPSASHTPPLESIQPDSSE